MRGTCKYIYPNVLRIKNNIMIELFLGTHNFTYYGSLYNIEIPNGHIYMSEYDFHKYFSVESIVGD
jgi:hypothetical protein